MIDASPKPSRKTPDAASRRLTPPHYAFLDGMRGFAALYVTFHHFIGWNLIGVSPAIAGPLRVFGSGHTVVSIFIVLSGFSLMLPVVSSPEGKLRGGFIEYIRRRARRILPPYYAALLLSVALPAFAGAVLFSQPILPKADSLVAHIFMAHNLAPRWSSDINIALWSVATEWQIYFLFPLILLPVWRRFGNAALIATGFFLGVLPIFRAETLSNACPWYIGLFALGQAGASLSARITPETNPRQYAMRLTLIVCALLTLYTIAGRAVAPFVSRIGPVAVNYLTETLKDGLLGGGVLCVILYCFLRRRCGDENSLLLRFLESRAGMILAPFSYSLYLTHAIILALLFTLGKYYQWESMTLLAFRAFVGVPLALALGYGFYLACERPFSSRRVVGEGNGILKPSQERMTMTSKEYLPK